MSEPLNAHETGILRDLHYLKKMAQESCDHPVDDTDCDCAGADRIRVQLLATMDAIATLRRDNERMEAVVEQLTDAIQAISDVVNGKARMGLSSVVTVASIAKHALATLDTDTGEGL